MKTGMLVLALMAAQVVQAGVLTEKIAKDYKILGTDCFAGGERTRFDFNGYEAWVVEPPAGVAVAVGCPWTWTMQWATAFVSRTPVSKLLAKGWRHVTIDTFKHRMDETGLEITRKYQDYLVQKLGFAPKACLIGMSWGGFFSTRYAKYCPGRVQAICYDAPLMNFEKGGYTDGRGEGPWTKRVPAEGWTASPEMPINMADAIVAQNIPVLLLYGGADRVVPPEQNCEIFIQRYKRLGGENLKVVRRGAYAHHPHGVEESDMSVANFFLEAVRTKSIAPEPLLSVREYDALERTARPKSMFVDGYILSELSKRAVAAGAYADEKEPPLAKRIAEKWPIVKTDEWKTDEWYGGRRTVFTFKGYEAWVVEPPAGVPVAKGAPWTWTMQWASDFVPRTGVPRLLSLGYRHVTLMQHDKRMTEEGLKLSKEFQEYLVNDLGFAPKANLIGLSWGGFYSVRYASTYPELVNKIYLDAPLLTFEGFRHDSGPWKGREPAGGWKDDPEMPVNRAAALAKVGIPILLAYGCSDTVVNPTTNCLAFAKAYEAAGGKKLKMIPRANFTHHPHGFDVGNGEVSCFFYFNNK